MIEDEVVWGKLLPGVFRSQGVAESQTVQDRESLIPRCRSGVPVPWDMSKPQGVILRTVKHADQRPSKGTEVQN